MKGTPSFPPQLEKNNEISPSKRDQALFLCSALRASLSSLSELERKLDSPYASQGIPQDTHCNSRGTPSFLPQLERNPMVPTAKLEEPWDQISTFSRVAPFTDPKAGSHVHVHQGVNPPSSCTWSHTSSLQCDLMSQVLHLVSHGQSPM